MLPDVRRNLRVAFVPYPAMPSQAQLSESLLHHFMLPDPACPCRTSCSEATAPVATSGTASPWSSAPSAKTVPNHSTRPAPASAAPLGPTTAETGPAPRAPLGGAASG